MQNFSEKVVFADANEQFGRHLKAAIDIEAGDVLIEESPLLVTTHWECEQMKCAKCCEDSFVMCKKCQFFPLCIDCTEHDAFECEFFTKATKAISKNLLINTYALNSILKLLLVMENPATSEKCTNLVPHNFKLNEYRNTDMWQDHEVSIVQPIMDSGLMDCFRSIQKAKGDMQDSDFLHKMCILIDANAFEVSSKVTGDSLKGLYVHAAKMPHHCVPNTATAIDNDYNMKIYAAVPIKAGEVIYNSFTNPLMGTIQRQHHLRMTRHIECHCFRCLDPTELNTHMSSVKCKECPEGFAICSHGKWMCMDCNAVLDAASVQKLLIQASEDVGNANGDVMAYEQLLHKYAGDFHPNHFLMIDLKQNIATILRAVLINSMRDPNKDVLRRRVDLCEEILPVVKAVIPGYSKLYAIALYEYLLSFLELAELDFRSKEIPKDLYIEKLQVAKEICLESKELLSFEPSNSPEGHLVRRIAIQQEQIDESLSKFDSK
ncbi:SET domain-containing protein SmydA-8 [Stomoxys calcitrans]|uniref:SET domain-containing protein SmydA-8 n=1 Tax=Stomoxys calcitrans TaxID=35570 RepID=UPI0027E3609D|nr:SET domain-containing protein SmydA-8 [Stomoxys calcitrans]